MQERLRRLLASCHAPDCPEPRWERVRTEWSVRSDKPYLDIRFAEPGRTAVLRAFNAWSLEAATHIIEVPGITSINDAGAALREAERWCALSNKEQHEEWVAWEAKKEEQALLNYGESVKRDLPRWGYARGGTWTQHYATRVAEIQRIKYGRDKGRVRAFYYTLCGKTLSLELMRDTKKPVCSRCQELLSKEGSKSS